MGTGRLLAVENLRTAGRVPGTSATTTTNTTPENVDVATVASVVIVASAVGSVALESKETSAIFIRRRERRS